ncbi:MAG: 50S ribosomal protein L9 [Actinobacteria bacterium]|jgi:large subunit ribosomal protein L9|nr:50S ribosomal protein L9 [Actinomycetota bacterium]
MKVLLRDDVKSLGKRGDIVDVADGYARNLLVPSGAALVATEKMTQQAAAMRRARDLKEGRDREAAQRVQELLMEAPIKVYAKAGKEGRLFGSVTASDISDAIRVQIGAEIDRKTITVAIPIRSLGVHNVTLDLYTGITAEVALEVLPETGET